MRRQVGNDNQRQMPCDMVGTLVIAALHTSWSRRAWLLCAVRKARTSSLSTSAVATSMGMTLQVISDLPNPEFKWLRNKQIITAFLLATNRQPD